MTSPARTVLDLAAEVPGKALRPLVRQALAEGRVSIRQLTDGHLPTRSELEDLALDLDGAMWHQDPLTRRDDAEKHAILEAHGYRVPRVTWRQVVDHPPQTLVRIRAALGLDPP